MAMLQIKTYLVKTRKYLLQYFGTTFGTTFVSRGKNVVPFLIPLLNLSINTEYARFLCYLN